jgi:hypothetical protein
MLIGRAQQHYWKLKAVDTIESSSSNTLTPEERVRLISIFDFIYFLFGEFHLYP